MTEQRIAKLIEDNCISGRKVWDVFEDWLDIVQASLIALPRHAASMAATGHFADETPEDAALWARLLKVYSKGDFENFQSALHTLMNTAAERMLRSGTIDDESDNWDIIGSAYMMLNVQSNHSGQYFTPWSVAKMMAYSTIGDGLAEVNERIKAALPNLDGLEQAIAHSALLAGAATNDTGVLESVVWPAVAQCVEPITVNDCACGSGVMLLAAASCYPEWCRRWGFVRFSGQDIDHTCVKMGNINMMLYGLNGWGLRWQMATHQMAAKLPPPKVEITVDEPSDTGADIELQQGGLFADVPDAASGASRPRSAHR